MMDKYDPITQLKELPQDSDEELEESKPQEPSQLETCQLLKFMQDYADKLEEWERNRYETLQKVGGEEFEHLKAEIHKK